MKNNWRYLKLLQDRVDKQQNMENKFKMKSNFIDYFSDIEKKQIVEKFCNNDFLGNKIKLNTFIGLKKYNETELKITNNISFNDFVNADVYDDVTPDQNVNSYEIEVWSPMSFLNRNDVYDFESAGNLEIMRHYRDILISLQNAIPTQDWFNLFNMLRFAIAQVMRHLIVIVKYNDGTIMMVHLTHANSIKKLIYSGNGHIVPEELGVQEILENSGQMVSNPVIISEDFYNRLIREGGLLEETTDSVNSELNESILVSLGLNNNAELVDHILYLLSFVLELKLLRGVSLYESVIAHNDELLFLEEYYDEYELNEQMRVALDSIFFMFYKKNE